MKILSLIFLNFFLNHLLNRAQAVLRNFCLFEQGTQTGTEFERGSNFELRPLAPQQSITHSPQKREQRKSTIAPVSHNLGFYKNWKRFFNAKNFTGRVMKF